MKSAINSRVSKVPEYLVSGEPIGEPSTLATPDHIYLISSYTRIPSRNLHQPVRFATVEENYSSTERDKKRTILEHSD